MNNFDLYLNGMLDIISSFVMPSYIKGYGFKDEDEFYNFYNISKEKVNIELVKESYEDFLKEIFNLDGRVLETFIYCISQKCGDYKKIYYLSGEYLEKKLHRYLPFYFIESVYLIEYEKNIICYIFGNNE